MADEHVFSQAFVSYVRDLVRAPSRENVYFVDRRLQPVQPCASKLLEQTMRVADFGALLGRYQAPNALAARLKSKLQSEADPERRAALASDLALARLIGTPARFVLVDTGSQRLWMVDEAGAAATMKVIVGKSGMDTPPMAGLIRFAVVNPYWDIPPDLVRNDIAPQVAVAGPNYLQAHNYEAVTSYDASGKPVDATQVDWNAVRAGSVTVGVRQLPGPDNMMGRVMFMFPNKFGIYLHDTPGRWLFSRSDRRLSHGCVRLEHAGELYQWLFRSSISAAAEGEPQSHHDLQSPVPVYLLPFSSAPLP
jgi:murein L,D-transpeptidase YcbB/YkuD